MSGWTIGAVSEGLPRVGGRLGKRLRLRHRGRNHRPAMPRGDRHGQTTDRRWRPRHSTAPARPGTCSAEPVPGTPAESDLPAAETGLGTPALRELPPSGRRHPPISSSCRSVRSTACPGWSRSGCRPSHASGSAAPLSIRSALRPATYSASAGTAPVARSRDAPQGSSGQPKHPCRLTAEGQGPFAVFHVEHPRPSIGLARRPDPSAGDLRPSGEAGDLGRRGDGAASSRRRPSAVATGPAQDWPCTATVHHHPADRPGEPPHFALHKLHDYPRLAAVHRP